MRNQRDLLLELEGILACGPTKTAKQLGVDYTGGYCAWKAQSKDMPRYVRESVLAHIAAAKLKGLYIKEHYR